MPERSSPVTVNINDDGSMLISASPATYRRALALLAEGTVDID
jgi:hypothetical protein